MTYCKLQPIRTRPWAKRDVFKANQIEGVIFLHNKHDRVQSPAFSWTYQMLRVFTSVLAWVGSDCHLPDPVCSLVLLIHQDRRRILLGEWYFWVLFGIFLVLLGDPFWVTRPCGVIYGSLLGNLRLNLDKVIRLPMAGYGFRLASERSRLFSNFADSLSFDLLPP